MLRKITSIVMALALVITGIIYTPKAVNASVTSGAGSGSWSLVWSDEFNGTPGSAPNSEYWGYNIGGGGWGNNELQTYTDSTSNVYIAETGGTTDGRALAIKAKREWGDYFTSGRVISQNRQTIRYGRIEARLRVENGQQNGVWPAFWMMGNEDNWPNCGEIDIMEHRNAEREIISTLHWNPGGWGAGYAHSWYGSELNGQFSYVDSIADWHTYAVEWYEDCMKFFLDGNCFETIAINGEMEEFSRAHYILFNVAIGSTSSPFTHNITVDGSFTEATMFVDYVRAYQGSDGNFQISKRNNNVVVDPTTAPSVEDGFTACAKDVSTNVGDWNYMVGNWANADVRYQGGSLNDFALKVNSNSGYAWGIQAFTERGVTAGHTYNYSITMNSNNGGANVLLKDENADHDLTSMTLQSGDTVFSGTYTPSSDKIKFMFDLGALSGGTTVRITNVTLTDVGGGGEEQTPAPTTAPTNPDLPSGGDWNTVVNSNDAYQYANASNMEVVNVQHPDWASQDGIYMSTSEGIGYVTINGTKVGDSEVAINGAGAVIYLSALTSEESKVIYYRGDGSYLGSVDIKKSSGTVVEPDTPEQTQGTTENPTLPTGGSWSTVENSNNVYEYANANNMEVVNVQHPDWAGQDGIYMSTSEGIGYVTINGTKVGDDAAAINGAGAVIYLSALNNETSQIIYYRSDGSLLGSVDIKKGEGSQEQTTSEEQTTPKEQTTPEEQTTPTIQDPVDITISNDINITGYQMTSSLHNIDGNMGLRVVYQAEQTVEGKNVTEVGLVYGLVYGNAPITESDVVCGSNSRYVKSYAATDAGRLSQVMGDSETASYYIRTMSCGVADGSNNISTKAYTTQYYVRAYAKLSDGSIVYSKVEKYKIYDIADHIYQNQLVNNEGMYNHLYTKILRYVNSSYQEGDYNWNNVVVK